MRQSLRNAVIITLIVAIILLVSVVAVVIEQGSKFKLEKSYFQGEETVKQIGTGRA